MKFTSNLDLLKVFFEAENIRDWNLFRKFLHPDVEWTVFNDSEGVLIRGRDNYMDRIISNYKEKDTKFECENTFIDGECNQIVAVLVKETGERSIDIFNFKKRLIWKEWEFILHK
ncbi:nuclear transport factor 2 family protein [candidate division WOR-3 bacterium]|nr:nuclear transport factor 2 family protein [candidate division WOR-3 bacterium]